MFDLYNTTYIFRDRNGTEVGRIKASNTKAAAYADDMQNKKGATILEIKGWENWGGIITLSP